MGKTGVYLLHVRETEKLDEELCDTLFPVRMERARRLRNREDYLLCVGVGALVAAVVGIGEDGMEHNEWGKPLIASGSPNISLSHSGEYSMLAINCDGTTVGADIERIHSLNMRRVAERMFTRDEIGWMNDGDASESAEMRFFRLWTMKESLGKLGGQGLSLSPSALSVLPLIKGEAVETKWGVLHGESEMFGNYIISVCTDSPTCSDGIAPTVLTAEELTKKMKKLAEERANDCELGRVYYADGHITVRTMRLSDARIITEGEIAQGWIHQTEEKYLTRLNDMKEGRAVALVAEYDGETAGYINVYPDSAADENGNMVLPEIVDFGVLEKFRRRGIGTKLMDVAESIAANYADTVCLGVGLHSGYGSAQRMYAKRGYIPDGSGVWYGDSVCPDYAECVNDDSLILHMSKELR